MTCIRQDSARDRVCGEPSLHVKVLYTVPVFKIAFFFIPLLMQKPCSTSILSVRFWLTGNSETA